MSVLDPVISSINGETRRIYLAQGTADFFPIEDIYHEYRNHRRTDENLRKYSPLLRAEGNVPKGGGAFTPRYVVLIAGTKIVPYDESLQLNQLGDMITDDPDTDPSLYDISGLTTAKPIFIKPSEAETIQLNSESIVYSSFQMAVWYDINSIYSDKGSSALPNGNRERPVNDLSLVIEIANERGFSTIQLLSNCTIGASHNIEKFRIVGASMTNIYVLVLDSALTQEAIFENVTLTGVLDGNSTVHNSIVNTLNYVNGQMHHCMINGPITLGGGATAHIHGCYSGVSGVGTPTIDMGGSGNSLALRAYDGGIKLINKTGTDVVSIDLNSGQVKLDPDTVTAGTIVCRGDGKVIDSITGNLLPSGSTIWNGVDLVNETSLAYLNDIPNAVWSSNEAIKVIKLLSNNVSKSGDIITIYEDDGTTVWKQFDLASGGRVEV